REHRSPQARHAQAPGACLGPPGATRPGGCGPGVGPRERSLQGMHRHRSARIGRDPTHRPGVAEAWRGSVRIGVSGWSYAAWRGRFYPETLARRRQLEYLARRMTTAEINGSFYSLQRPTSFRRWYEETPQGFIFAVKGSRFITH